MFSLKGRVVVVSGASSGLGAQMARGFADQGADLVILARRLEKLEALANELRKKGVKCLPLRCDVTDSKMVDEVALAVEKEFGIKFTMGQVVTMKNVGEMVDIILATV